MVDGYEKNGFFFLFIITLFINRLFLYFDYAFVVVVVAGALSRPVYVAASSVRVIVVLRRARSYAFRARRGRAPTDRRPPVNGDDDDGSGISRRWTTEEDVTRRPVSAADADTAAVSPHFF